MATEGRKMVPEYWRWVACGALLWGAYHYYMEGCLRESLANQNAVYRHLIDQIPPELHAKWDKDPLAVYARTGRLPR